MNGLIFDIQRFSTHDGPGIRTTVFLKGCSMSCLWCHNPESINRGLEIQFFKEKCIGCGKCFEICPFKAHKIYLNNRIFEREKCIKCGKCVEECFAEALVLKGKLMSIDEVLEIIEKDRSFYENSGGGVTFSGGEPTLQKEFLYEILKVCKERKIHTVVETAGNVPYENIINILPFTDLFLYDLKIMNEKMHQKWAGTGNKRIHENLKMLSDEGANINIRVPLIPNINNTKENIDSMIDFLKGLKGINQIELIPFHKMASFKYESLDIKYEVEDFKLLKDKELEYWVEYIKGKGINAVAS